MAIFDRIPRADLGTRFTHKGWFAFCPVYIGDVDSESPMLAARNWVPEWLFTLAADLQQLSLDFIEMSAGPDSDAGFLIVVTGELEPPEDAHAKAR